MDEDNLEETKLHYPGKFSEAMKIHTNEGVFLKSNAIPVLTEVFKCTGKIVQEMKKLMSLQVAIRKLAKLPATHLKIKKTG